MPEELLRQLGFSSSAEFHGMVSNADISSAEKMAAFQCWQENDGTKAGLEALPTISAAH